MYRLTQYKLHCRRILAALTGTIIFGSTVYGDIAEQASQLLYSGDAKGALEMAESELQANPKSKENGALNLVAAECALSLGKYNLARDFLQSAKSCGENEAILMLADYYTTHEYNFDKAADLYKEYITSLKKKGIETESESIELMQTLPALREAMNRVEDIVVLDSVTLSEAEFLSQYRLPASAGMIVTDPTTLGLPENVQPNAPVYTNQWGDLLLWSEEIDSTGNTCIIEASRLTDGSWHVEPLSELSEYVRDSCFPFMQPDGLTLYFAGREQGGLGGLDIMVTTRDGTTGRFRKPQNMGMPYNSPDDDFMLMIDEETGIGRWATTRNSPDGMVTVYTYIPNDIRKNYDPSNPNITDLARMTNWKSTQNDTVDYAPIRRAIAEIMPMQIKPVPEFTFRLSSQKTLHRWSELTYAESEAALREYFDTERTLTQQLADIKSAREAFASGDRSSQCSERILILERDIELTRLRLRNLRNDIFRYEMNR